MSSIVIRTALLFALLGGAAASSAKVPAAPPEQRVERVVVATAAPSATWSSADASRPRTAPAAASVPYEGLARPDGASQRNVAGKPIDASDRSDMAMMILVGVAMVATVMAKSSRS